MLFHFENTNGNNLMCYVCINFCDNSQLFGNVSKHALLATSDLPPVLPKHLIEKEVPKDEAGFDNCPGNFYYCHAKASNSGNWQP